MRAVLPVLLLTSMPLAALGHPGGHHDHTERRTVLSDPGGDTKVDARIRKMQANLRARPDRVDGWVLLGRAFVQKARQATAPHFYEQARACAKRALDLRPNYPLALDLEALALMNQHRFSDAKRLATRILDRDPDDLLALGTLADATLELGEVDAAVAAVERMMDLKPSLPTYTRAAYLRWLHGDVAGAQQVYRLAIDAGQGSADPEPLAWVLAEAAQLFLLKGDLDTAKAGFERALATQAAYPAAHAGLGHIALHRGRPGEAAQHFQAAYRELPLAPTAAAWADALAAAGDEPGAARARARALKRGRAGERRALARQLAVRGAPAADLAEADRAIEKELVDRGDHLGYAALAQVRLRQGRLAEARRAIDFAQRLGTPDPRLDLYEGLVARAEGRVGHARAVLARALARGAVLTTAERLEAAQALADLATASLCGRRAKPLGLGARFTRFPRVGCEQEFSASPRVFVHVELDTFDSVASSELVGVEGLEQRGPAFEGTVHPDQPLQ